MKLFTVVWNLFFLLWDYISSHLQTFFKALKVYLFHLRSISETESVDTEQFPVAVSVDLKIFHLIYDYMTLYSILSTCLKKHF